MMTTATADHVMMKPRRLGHAYQLADEDDRAACEKKLHAANIQIKSEINLPTKRGIVIQDPDGMSVEFYRRIGEKRQSAKVDVQPYL
jgi:hypothetical protein